jgi:hypothetical protein
MAAFTVNIEGLAELNERLNSLAKDEVYRISQRALRAGGAVFQAEEQERAPMRPNLPSGTALPPGALKNDVIVTGIKGADGLTVVQVRPGKLTVNAAHLVEYGHELVLHGRHVASVPAYPYARPAFEAGGAAALDAVAASLRADLDKIDAKRKV